MTKNKRGEPVRLEDAWNACASSEPRICHKDISIAGLCGPAQMAEWFQRSADGDEVFKIHYVQCEDATVIVKRVDGSPLHFHFPNKADARYAVEGLPQHTVEQLPFQLLPVVDLEALEAEMNGVPCPLALIAA